LRGKSRTQECKGCGGETRSEAERRHVIVGRTYRYVPSRQVRLQVTNQRNLDVSLDFYNAFRSARVLVSLSSKVVVGHPRLDRPKPEISRPKVVCDSKLMLKEMILSNSVLKTKAPALV